MNSIDSTFSGLRKVVAEEMDKDVLRKLVEAANRPEHEAAARRVPWAKLRGDTWLNYVMSKTQWSWADLKQELGKNRARSHLVDRWRNEEVNPYRVSAQKLDKRVPGSLALFDLPMWGLLGPGPKTKREIQRLEEIAESSGPLPDEIGATVGRDNAYRGCYPEMLYGSASLVMEGSLRSFNELILRVRRAEAHFNDRDHADNIASLYMLFPTIAKLPYFAPSTVGLAQAISDLHHRVEWSRASVGVDWNVICSAINGSSEEADREELLLAWIRSGASGQISPINRGNIVSASDTGDPSLVLGDLNERSD